MFCFQVDTTSPPGQDSVTAQSKMLKYPTQDEAIANSTPVTFVLTQFHAALLYTDRVVVVCLLNEEVVFQDVFSAEVCTQFLCQYVLFIRSKK